MRWHEWECRTHGTIIRIGPDPLTGPAFRSLGRSPGRLSLEHISLNDACFPVVAGCLEGHLLKITPEGALQHLATRSNWRLPDAGRQLPAASNWPPHRNRGPTGHQHGHIVGYRHRILCFCRRVRILPPLFLDPGDPVKILVSGFFYAQSLKNAVRFCPSRTVAVPDFAAIFRSASRRFVAPSRCSQPSPPSSCYSALRGDDGGFFVVDEAMSPAEGSVRLSAQEG